MRSDSASSEVTVGTPSQHRKSQRPLLERLWDVTRSTTMVYEVLESVATLGCPDTWAALLQGLSMVLITSMRSSSPGPSLPSSHQKSRWLPDFLEQSSTVPLGLQFGDETVEPGIILTPWEVRYPPRLHFPTEPNALYTVFMGDFDAPSVVKPVNRMWANWLVANVPGTNVTAGDPLMEYVSPGPLKGTGHHRYIVLVYQQPDRLDLTEELKLDNRTITGREKFNIGQFADRFNLGQVADNFFMAEWDEYVPKLYKLVEGI